jgi:alanine racemase
MPPVPPPPLRLSIDLEALAANWRWFRDHSDSAACGAAIKADGYGLGARATLDRLAREGCRDFFVATWAEAALLHPLADGLRLSILHGVRESDLPFAVASNAVPVLNTASQVALWKAAAPGRACDIMVDTGMNRLGLSVRDGALLDGLNINTLMSHLACGEDADSAMNEQQRASFAGLGWSARRRSLANSGGVTLGPNYAFDLTRPGIGLYGGTPGPGIQVARIETLVLQVRDIGAGDSVGYGATLLLTGRCGSRS